MPTNARGYDVPTLATDAIVVRDGRVLLVRRRNPPAAGSWALPGGFVEVGEPPEAACVRELQEETGLAGEVRAVAGVYGDPDRDPRGHVVTVVYAVDAPAGEPRGGDDAAEAAWHPLDALPELAFDHGRILADFLTSSG